MATGAVMVATLVFVLADPPPPARGQEGKAAEADTEGQGKDLPDISDEELERLLKFAQEKTSEIEKLRKEGKLPPELQNVEPSEAFRNQFINRAGRAPRPTATRPAARPPNRRAPTTRPNRFRPTSRPATQPAGLNLPAGTEDIEAILRDAIEDGGRALPDLDNPVRTTVGQTPARPRRFTPATSQPVRGLPVRPVVAGESFPRPRRAGVARLGDGVGALPGGTPTAAHSACACFEEVCSTAAVAPGGRGESVRTGTPCSFWSANRSTCATASLDGPPDASAAAQASRARSRDGASR